MTEPAIAEATIRALLDAKVFDRGLSYYHSGAVSALTRRGDMLSADVHGSEFEPYRVEIGLHNGGVAHAKCSCPSDYTDYCKHIAAALIKFAKEPEAVIERPTIGALLQELSRDALEGLLLKRLEADPSLASWIEAELALSPDAKKEKGCARPAVDPEPFREHARLLLAGGRRRRGYWDDYRSSGNIEELHRLVEKAVPFLEAGDGSNALRVLEAIAETFVENWFEYYDSDEDMYLLFDDLGRLMAEAALMSDLTLDQRDDLADKVREWRGRLDDYGAGDGFEVAIRAVENGWDEPGLEAVMNGEGKVWPLCGTDNETGRDLTIVRLRVLEAFGRDQEYLNLARAAGQCASYAEHLVKLSRVAEAVEFGLTAFRSPDDALALAKALQQAAAHDEALRIAEAGLSLEGKKRDDWHRPVSALAHWLRDYAGGLGRKNLAVEAATIAFDCTLSMKDYEAASNWSGENWTDLRAKLLERLAQAPHASDRVRIYLSEAMIDEAVACVGEEETFGIGDDTLMQLADAAHASHSGWVIRLARRQASRIMDENRSSHYEDAARWLQKMARASMASGQTHEWGAELEALILKHRRKYKLRPLLEALRQRVSP
jgi:uncharacterized Zn finger protein